MITGDDLLFKFANMNQHYHKYSFEFFLESTLRVGLNAIELWGGIPHFYVNEVTSEEINKMRKDICVRNLELVCFTPEQCIYPVNLSSHSKITRDRSVEYFKKCIDVANLLECNKMVVNVGYGLYDESIKLAWKRGLNSLYTLTEYAEQKNVILLLEQMSKTGSNIVNDFKSLKMMYEEINSSYLKVMVDTALMEVVGDSLKQYKVFDKDLAHIHFIDGDSKTNAHLAWGEGNFSLNEYFKVLTELDYNGYLTLELISPKYNWDPEEGISNSINTLKNFGIYE